MTNEINFWGGFTCGIITMCGVLLIIGIIVAFFKED